jgi:uncharacterized phiE125 gp8 family phage protein
MLTPVTTPTVEPVSTTEAKLHLRLDLVSALEEGDLALKIAAARQKVERATGRQIMPARWQLKLDAFPVYEQPILIPLPPLRGIVSISYVDAGETKVWDPSNYSVVVPLGEMAEPGLVFPIPGTCWPDSDDIPNAVTIEFDAGYDGSVQPAPPAGLKAAILLEVGALYENREDGPAAAAGAAARLMDPFRAEVA